MMNDESKVMRLFSSVKKAGEIVCLVAGSVTSTDWGMTVRVSSNWGAESTGNVLLRRLEICAATKKGSIARKKMYRVLLIRLTVRFG